MFIVNMTGVNTFGDNCLMEALHERLRHIRKKAGHSSARSAAIRFGWSPSTYAAHENGQNSFDAEVALRYATAFKADPSWLLFAKDSTPENEQAGFVFKIAGYVYDKHRVDYIPSNSNRPLETVILFVSLYNNTFLFLVKDESLWPKYEKGDLLVCRPVYMTDKHDIYLGKDGIFDIDATRTSFRQAQRTDREGHYDLTSANSPTLRDVPVSAAVLVNAVIKSIGYSIRPESGAGYRP